MQPDDMGSPAQWITFAESDLALARHAGEENVLLGSLCFHAQQAAEKSVKAVLVHRGVHFRKTHNLAVLLELLPSDAAPSDGESIAGLTAYAVAARYPGVSDEIDEAEYRESLAVARVRTGAMGPQCRTGGEAHRRSLTPRHLGAP